MRASAAPGWQLWRTAVTSVAGEVEALYALALARLSGDYAEARVRYLAGIELNEALGRPETVNSECHNLAFAELHLGHLDRARELFAEDRERVFRRGYRTFVPYLGVAAAALASAAGDHAEAARMLGFTDSAFAAIGQVPDPDDAADLLKVRAAAVAGLGEDAFASACAAGAVLGPAEAFGLDWPPGPLWRSRL